MAAQGQRTRACRGTIAQPLADDKHPAPRRISMPEAAHSQPPQQDPIMPCPTLTATARGTACTAPTISGTGAICSPRESLKALAAAAVMSPSGHRERLAGGRRRLRRLVSGHQLATHGAKTARAKTSIA